MEITVYTKPSCVQCGATKRKLDQLGVPYTPIDMSQDDEALEYVKSLGYQSAPVVVAGDKHWYGYNPAELEALV